MTRPTSLERGYRRLLSCYPKDFRQDSGPELLGVLLDTARPGQRHVRPAEALDLVRGAVRMRLGHRTPPGSVRAAVRLMWLGAALEVVALMVIPTTYGAVHDAVSRTDPGQWQTISDLLALKAFAAGLGIVAWPIAAFATRAGRPSAPGWSAWCFGWLTFSLTVDFPAAPYAPADTVILVGLWVVALVTLVLLCGRRSRSYYRPRARADR